MGSDFFLYCIKNVSWLNSLSYEAVQIFFFTYILMDSKIQGVTNDTWHPGRNISLRINPYLQTPSNFVGQPFILDPYLLQFHKAQILFLSSCELQALQKFRYKTKFLFTSETQLKFIVVPPYFVFSLRMQNVARKYIHNLGWGAKGKEMTHPEVYLVGSPRDLSLLVQVRCTLLRWRRYIRKARLRHYSLWV